MKNQKALRYTVILFMLLGTSFSNSVCAQEENSSLAEFTLDGIVVAASRMETAVVDTPVNTTIVTAERIKDRQYQDVSDIMKDVSGANVVDSGVGASAKTIMLNGDTRVLILVDGRRVNNDVGATFGAATIDMNQLPDVEMIERIEVMKGYGGVLYGSDAVGGVINIITKKADGTCGKASLALGSNQARNAKAMYSFKEGKTGIMVSAAKFKQGYYKYKDIKTGTTKRRTGGSAFDSEKVSLKIAHELTDTTNLTIGYDYSNFDGRDPGDYMGANFGVVVKENNNLYAKYDWQLKELGQGYLQIYHNRFDYGNTYSLRGKPYTDEFSEKATGLEIQQAVATSDTNNLVLGTSYRSSEVKNKSYINGEQSIYNKALFISDVWEFAPTWILNTGVRLDDHKTAGSDTTFSAGLNKKFDKDSHVYFNWGQVFKAPTIDNLYNGTTSMVGNANLKAETGETWTLGYGATFNDKTNVNIDYFQSNLHDAIRWHDDDGDKVWQVENVDRQKKNGLEVSVSHELDDNWMAEASYTYLRIRNDKGNGFVRDPNAAPNLYRMGVMYHNKQWKADLFMRMGTGGDTKTKKQSGDNYFIKSSYMTLDMAVTYKATAAWTIFAKGYNLLNEAYAEGGGARAGNYLYPAQGRHFLVGVEYSF